MPTYETKTSHTAWLLLAISVLILIRVLPLLKAPFASFGYDYGFYLYAASHAAKLSWNDFLTAFWGGFNSILFYLGHWLHLPPVILLHELYFILAVIFGISCYAYLKNKNPQAAIFACLLAAFSLVQSEAYLMFLWKNVVALPFLVLSFKFLEEKKYRSLALCTGAILLTHRTTAIVYLISVGIYIFFLQIKQKKWRIIIGELLMAAAAVIAWTQFYHFIAENLLYNKNAFVREGLFLNSYNIIALWWPMLLLAVPGAVLFIKHKQKHLLPIFTAVTLLWIILQLPFYRRMLIYLDVAVILYAAYFLGSINYKPLARKLALAIVLIFLGFQAASFIFSHEVLITPAEINEIKNFNQPAGFVLAPSANDAAALLGFLRNQRLGSAGLFEDPHTYQEWRDFWQGKNREQFLAAYPRPLYFYQRSYRAPSQTQNCLAPLSENFSLYTCP